jgi:outer membrane protein assembly factor BamB
MSSPSNDFATRLSGQLHKSLDAVPVDDLAWVDAQSRINARAGRTRRRVRVRVTATALVVAAAMAAVVVVAQAGTRRVSHPATPSRPQAFQVLATTAVGGSTPAWLAAGGGWVFAGLWDSGQLLRLDPITLRTTATLQVGSARNGPLSVAYGDGAVWVLNFADGRLWRVDPTTMTATLKVTLPAQPSQVAVGDGAVWVTGCCTSTDTSTRQRVLRIDPDTGAITGSRAVAGDGETVPLALGPDVVVTSQNGPVVVIDPHTMKVVRTLPDLCPGCNQTTGLLASEQGIYATSVASVVRYDPHSGRVLTTPPDLTDVEAPLSVQPDGVWFAATNRLLRLDPVTLAITGQAPIAVGGQLVELAGIVYVSSAGTVDKLGPAG